MPNWIESIFNNFERLLRWIYPGALFLLLLYLSNPKCLNYLEESDKYIWTNNLWLLIMLAIVAGIVIYFFQQLVVTAIISFFTVWSGWQIEPDPSKLRWKCCRKIAGHFNWWARTVTNRWKYPKRIDSYFNYAWGINHAAFITSWLTLTFFFFIKKDDSIMSTFPSWIIILATILLFLGSLIQHLWLTRAQAISYFPSQTTDAGTPQAE
jgi:hypothetical protein